MTVDEILIRAREAGASDVHFMPDEPPMMRVRGLLEPINMSHFSASQILDMLIQLLPQELREQYDDKGYCVGTYESSSNHRYRVSAYRQQSMAALAIRIIRQEPVTMLDLPEKLLETVKREQGLILLTGRPGSGRSTTLAALGQYLGNADRLHIMALGETMEHRIPCQGSVVSQRILKRDVSHLVRAIQEAKAIDVDVLLLDLLEGREAVQEAVRAATEGLLVVAVVNSATPGKGMQQLLEYFPLAERGDMEHRLRRVSLLEVHQEFVSGSEQWQIRYQC